MDYMLLGLCLFVIFSALGFYDSVVIHLIKYQLPLHKESRFEHLLHTARGFFQAIILPLLFLTPLNSQWVYIFSLVALLDMLVEFWDVSIEYRSRAPIGGFTQQEYLIHIVLTALRLTGYGVVLFGKSIGQTLSPWGEVAVWLLAAPALLLGLLSLTFYIWPQTLRFFLKWIPTSLITK